MLAFGALLGIAVVVLWPSSGSRPADPPAAPALTRPETQAARILRLWDSERAQAWALGDRRALRALYVDRAPAATSDVAMLDRWIDRGLRVQGLAMQVLRLDVIGRGDGWWRLRVTDRVSSADVVGPGMEGELVGPETPPGAARTRVLELREQDGTWRMASVTTA